MAAATSTAINPATARSTRGRAPVATPMLSGVVIDVTVTEMKLSFSEGQHDQASLSCVSSTLENTDGFVDSTFSFYFGVAPRANLFQGYVTDVLDEQDAQGQLSFTLTILGASKVMYEGKPRFWSDTSVSTAVKELASANLLGFYGHSHTTTWRALAQTEESDWTMLNALARRIGWVTYYRLGVILLYDPGRLYDSSGEYTNLVSSQTNPELIDTADSRNMIEFQATGEAEVLPENLGRKFGYFTTSDDVKIDQQPGTFKGFRFETSTVVRDQDEAAAYLGAADKSILGSTWRSHAVARIWGDADILPGMCVGVLTSSGSYSKNDGRWLVRSVSHQADRQTYQTQLMLSRPTNWVPSGMIAYRPFWEEDMTTTRARPYLQDSEGKWYSSWRTT